MGMLGGVLGGSLLGIGASSMSKPKLPDYSYPTDVQTSMEASKPDVPESPASPENEGQGNALMEAEREKERQQAALRQQQAREVYTSGLGAAGMADTAKKSLLGG